MNARQVSWRANACPLELENFRAWWHEDAVRGVYKGASQDLSSGLRLVA